MQWIKILERHLGREESQTHIRAPSLGSQHQEDKSPKLLAAKIVGIESVKETTGAPSSSS